jgi:hypothetical protein
VKDVRRVWVDRELSIMVLATDYDYALDLLRRVVATGALNFDSQQDFETLEVEIKELLSAEK